tara:strand:- start:2478 stop:3263 length:786 start_codon:yes stop_codon:yes gene_type:complete
MRRIVLFFVFILASCKSIDQIEADVEIIQGQSAGYVLIPIKENIDSGYSITLNNEQFLVYGLPYVDKDTEINFKGRTILVNYSDFGESRIEIDNESLVNPSIEDRERASGEYLKIRSIIKGNSTQFDQDFNFLAPVNAVITSPFGKRRFINDSPRSPHMGLDIRGAVGTSIVAPKMGKVVLAENHFYSGNIVILDHGGGLFTSFSHLDSFIVQVGEIVDQGQEFAFVGSTGRVTGPHLHWVVYLNGNRINPELLVNLEDLN